MSLKYIRIKKYKYLKLFINGLPSLDDQAAHPGAQDELAEAS